MNAWLKKKYNGTSSEKTRKNLEASMEVSLCSSCQGQRLAPFSLEYFH